MVKGIYNTPRGAIKKIVECVCSRAKHNRSNLIVRVRTIIKQEQGIGSISRTKNRIFEYMMCPRKLPSFNY